MKASVCLLLAVTGFTLFLGSTASIIDGLTNATEIISIVQVTDQDKQELNDIIKLAFDTLASMKKVVADASREDSNIDASIFVELKVFLTELGAANTLLAIEINTSMATGSVAVMKSTVATFQAGLGLTIPMRDRLVGKLPPGDVRDAIQKGTDILTEKSLDVIKIFEKYYV